MVLDKNRNQLIDSLNNSNKVYTNEELTALITNLQTQITNKDEQIKSLESKVESLALNNPKGYHVFRLNKYVTGNNYTAQRIKISNIKYSIMVNIKMFGNYNYINYGGFVDYTFAGFTTGQDTNVHGVGTSINKQGSLGNFISSITYNVYNNVLYFNINFNQSSSGNQGSEVNYYITIYTPDIAENITVEAV